LFPSESEVEPVIALWIACNKVVGAVPGKHSMPIAVIPASKGVADDSIVNWFMATLAYLGRYSWLDGLSSAGEPCPVRCFLRHVATMLLATRLSQCPSSLWKCLSTGSSFTLRCVHARFLRGLPPLAEELSGPLHWEKNRGCTVYGCLLPSSPVIFSGWG
jgi:hypothetical protein